MTEALGWAAAAILVITIGSQVFKQWHDGTSRGVSYWLFLGEFVANSLFLTYALLIGNYVFLTANAALLLTSLLGLWLKWTHSRNGDG